MNKSIFTTVLACSLIAGSVLAERLECTLIMGNDKSWEGFVINRDGDWVEFMTGSSPTPIRVGADTIKELEFDIEIDAEEMNQMNRDREYARIISVLERKLKPYLPYDDIPSNLSDYKAVLMEVHYKVGNYDDTIKYASQLAMDERDPDLQKRARVYQALSMIDGGREADAEALMAELGWNEGLDEDAAPEKLYIMGKLMALKKDYATAMELVAKVIAFNSQDPEWMQPAELFCAEVYTELGLFDSAEEVIRQISLLYPNTNEDDRAQKLKIRIEKLRAEKELQESMEEEI